MSAGISYLAAYTYSCSNLQLTYRMNDVCKKKQFVMPIKMPHRATHDQTFHILKTTKVNHLKMWLHIICFELPKVFTGKDGTRPWALLLT